MSRHPLSALPVAAAVWLMCATAAMAATAAPTPAASETPTPSDTPAAPDADAADPADPSDPAAATGRRLDRVTVHATRQRTAHAVTKLPLTARETPQSISAVDLPRLELQSLISIDDVMRQITGVNVSFYDTQRPIYFSRGFQITDFQVDGVPTYSSGTNQEYDTVFYDRIDVIRGANGLATGAGVPSATVNMTRKRPARTLQGSAAWTLGSWDHHRLEADVSVPLTQDGRIRSRFITALQERESYRDRYSESKVAFMGVIEADLRPGTVLTLGYQDQNNVPKGPIWGTIPRFASDGSLANLPRSSSFSPAWTRWSRQSGTAYAMLEHRLGEDWTLKAIANHSEGDTMSLRTYASGYPDPVTGAGLKLLAGVGQSWEKRDSLDLYASGRFSLLGRSHDLVVGANGVRTRTTTPTLTSVTGWSYDIPNVYTWDGSAPAPTYRATGARRVATTEQSGVYASARWRLAEPLALITGARLSRWKTGTDAYNNTGAFTGTSGAYEIKDEVTPYLGVIVDVARDWSLYASYSDIFKPQNYKDINGNMLSPVKGSNSEIGIKGELLDQRLAVSFAAFKTRQDDLGVALPPQPGQEETRYQAVDGTQSEGFEADLSGQLAPGWTLNAGYTNVRTRRQATDLIYANLPRHSVQLNTSVRLPGAARAWTVGGGVNWQSKVTGANIPHPVLGTVTVEQPAYALVQLHAQVELSEHVSLNLAVRNLLDKRYWANLDYPNYGDPRSFLLTVRGQF